MTKKTVKAVSSPLIQKLRKRITPSEARKVEDAMRLAANISNLMKQHKLNNTRLIERLKAIGVEVQPSMVTRWLSGTHNFTQGTLSDIALALEVETAELYGRQKKEPQPVYMIHGTAYKQMTSAYNAMNWISKISPTPSKGSFSC